jgi:hypothetical protein
MPDTPERDPTTGIPLPPAFGAGMNPQSLEAISGELAGGYNTETLPSWVRERYSPHQIEAAQLAGMRDFANASNQNTASALNQFAGVQAGAPPAMQEEGSPYSYRAFPDIFKKGAPPTGYFNLQDYYGQLRQPDGGSGYGQVPGQFQYGSGMLSTNDWRQLPGPWRNPDYFMINGRLISRSKFDQQVKGLEFSNMGVEGGTNPKGFSPGNYGAPWTYAGWTANAGLGGTEGLNSPRYLGQLAQ